MPHEEQYERYSQYVTAISSSVIVISSVGSFRYCSRLGLGLGLKKFTDAEPMSIFKGKMKLHSTIWNRDL